MPEGNIQLDVKLDHPRCVFFFDQFGVAREEGFVHIHFGFKSNSYAGNGLIVVISEDIVAANKENFLKYLHEIGLPEKSFESSYRAREAREVVFADIWGVARQGQTAEMLFHCFSWKLIVDKQRTAHSGKGKAKENPIGEAHCVAIVRSGVEIHRNLIEAIYASQSKA
jgi:hypothetical protein